LDGIHWSESGSERVAKKTRRLGNGEDVIPLSLHEEKMAEQAHALRGEMEVYLGRLKDNFVEQHECDEVEAIFLRELSVDQRGDVFKSVVNYYKVKPQYCTRSAMLSVWWG
jgi:hypothetical protein